MIINISDRKDTKFLLYNNTLRIINISDRKDTKFLLYNNTLSVEIKFHWQIIAFFLAV